MKQMLQLFWITMNRKFMNPIKNINTKILLSTVVAATFFLTNPSSFADDKNLGCCGRTFEVEQALLVATNKQDCKQITAQDLQKITSLDLSFHNITTLKRGDFSGLTKLETLNLSNNQLDLADAANYLYGLINLKVLNLSHNSVRAHLDLDPYSNSNSDSDLFSQSVFPNLPVLEDLNLSYTALGRDNVSFGAGFFSNLTNLRVLDLSNNELSCGDLLSEDFKGLESLTTLDLRNNNITNCYRDRHFVFYRTPLLQTIDISLNPIELDADEMRMIKEKVGTNIELIYNKNALSTEIEEVDEVGEVISLTFSQGASNSWSGPNDGNRNK